MGVSMPGGRPFDKPRNSSSVVADVRGDVAAGSARQQGVTVEFRVAELVELPGRKTPCRAARPGGPEGLPDRSSGRGG